ncbi:MAG: long-chain fatty acid--CoA ligase, partial [Clostridiales bacterium]|nr:long-chain fatty acid--CoA ligase [Clostridiales bacterium]
GTSLLELGLNVKRIAVIGENRYEWVTAYMATVCGVGTIVPLDRELPENEIESLLSRARVNALFFSGSCRKSITAIAKRVSFIEYYADMDSEPEITSNGSQQETTQESQQAPVQDSGNGFTPFSFQDLVNRGKAALANGSKAFAELEIDPAAMNILLFTSATTDKSKAVMLSHNNLTKNLIAMSSMTNIIPSDIFLSVLPLHHTYENTCGFLCPIYRGASVAFCEGLRHIPKNLQESKATVMLGVPLIFEAIYKRIWDQAAKSGADKKLRFAIGLSDFLRKFGIDITRKLFAAVHNNFGGKLRLLISGAAGIDPKVAKGFRDLGFIFIQGYGLTECSPIVALNRDCDFKDSAAGLPLPGLEVKIDDPNQEGTGEIIVKGESVMLGYYENEEATSKVLKDGWFHTGDLGYIDHDGFVHITGRKKNVIVTKNGKNIYPEEIETLLGRSPFILESLVYGKKEEGSDEMIVAATIVPDMEAIKQAHEGKEPSEEELREILQKEVKSINKSLVTYKYIKDFNVRMEEFAKTTSKKIKRYQQ